MKTYFYWELVGQYGLDKIGFKIIANTREEAIFKANNIMPDVELKINAVYEYATVDDTHYQEYNNKLERLVTAMEKLNKCASVKKKQK